MHMPCLAARRKLCLKLFYNMKNRAAVPATAFIMARRSSTELSAALNALASCNARRLGQQRIESLASF